MKCLHHPLCWETTGLVASENPLDRCFICTEGGSNADRFLMAFTHHEVKVLAFYIFQCMATWRGLSALTTFPFQPSLFIIGWSMKPCHVVSLHRMAVIQIGFSYVLLIMQWGPYSHSHVYYRVTNVMYNGCPQVSNNGVRMIRQKIISTNFIFQFQNIMIWHNSVIISTVTSSLIQKFSYQKHQSFYSALKAVKDFIHVMMWLLLGTCHDSAPFVGEAFKWDVKREWNIRNEMQRLSAYFE